MIQHMEKKLTIKNGMKLVGFMIIPLIVVNVSWSIEKIEEL